MSSLKEQNRLQLASLLGAPLGLALIVQMGGSAFENLLSIPLAAGAAAVIASVLVMLADVIPQDIKHKLVFLRMRNALPGHRCNKLCAAEPRLDHDALQARWPDVFGDGARAKQRNQLWYRTIYKPVQDSPEVASAHQKFLLYRDATAGCFASLLLMLLWFLTDYAIPYLGIAKSTCLYIIMGFLMLYGVCARNHGNRMVVNAVVAHDD